MEKGNPPQESAPPYPGPPLNYGGAIPQPEMYPQPGSYPQPGMHPQPEMYPQSGSYPQPGMHPQPGTHPQPGFYPGPPPPAGYQAGVPYVNAAPTTTVTHLVVSAPLHDVPGQTMCPHCQQTVITQTNHTAGLMTWAICAALTFFGCFLCCCIPFCLDSCQDVEHRCSNCHKLIYIYKRM
uniref:cell death-inducing p53-target protein 1 homolog n=1 Tax=Semicossyphus pulcher TaxID=241346 RepID=UPI0037E81B98